MDVVAGAHAHPAAAENPVAVDGPWQGADWESGGVCGCLSGPCEVAAAEARGVGDDWPYRIASHWVSV